MIQPKRPALAGDGRRPAAPAVARLREGWDGNGGQPVRAGAGRGQKGRDRALGTGHWARGGGRHLGCRRGLPRQTLVSNRFYACRGRPRRDQALSRTQRRDVEGVGVGRGHPGKQLPGPGQVAGPFVEIGQRVPLTQMPVPDVADPPAGSSQDLAWPRPGRPGRPGLRPPRSGPRRPGRRSARPGAARPRSPRRRPSAGGPGSSRPAPDAGRTNRSAAGRPPAGGPPAPIGRCGRAPGRRAPGRPPIRDLVDQHSQDAPGVLVALPLVGIGGVGHAGGQLAAPVGTGRR